VVQELEVFNSGLSDFSFFPGNISHSPVMNNPGQAVQELELFNSGLSAFAFLLGNIYVPGVNDSVI
jgi:hypothetical protein